MVLGDGPLQNEWDPGRMWAQNGDLELRKFEPYHFRTSYIHINRIIKNKSISAKQNRTGSNLDPH